MHGTILGVTQKRFLNERSMSIFDNKRQTNQTFKLDIDRMARGWYSDKYFENVYTMLTTLTRAGYRYDGRFPRPGLPDTSQLDIGDLSVEMQWFTRRPGATVVVGVDKALVMLRECTGYFDPPAQAGEAGRFVNTWDELEEVWAVQDGCLAHYPPRGNSPAGEGDPRHVQPVMRVRGRYRDLALLETPTLGILSRASRIATNVYKTLIAARGKPVLFFPARFDAHEVQAADGYAYNIAVQRFNLDYGDRLRAFVSTDAQGDWWGGAGGGTVPHAVIACFLGDTAAAMLAFASTVPPHVPRIALVDFNNDSVTDSLRSLRAMFERYRELMERGQESEAQQYILYGVRLDTSNSMRDVNVPPLGDPALDLGVTPRLVFTVRQALNTAWESWELAPQWQARAQAYCQNVKIVVSGGFSLDKIRRFEKLGVPVDIYGVGSSLMSNDAAAGTNTDFTADVVRIKINGEWIDMPKLGRRPCDNPDLERIK